MATKVPGIPTPEHDPRGALNAMKQIMEVREGHRGDPLDRFVTLRELSDLVVHDEAIVHYLTVAHAHDHGTLTGLGDDDHPQYLLADSDLDLSGYTLSASFLGLYDTDLSNRLILAFGEDVASDRNLTLTVNDGDRELNLQGNLTVESDSFVDQDLTQDSLPTFGGAYLGVDLDSKGTLKLYADGAGSPFGGEITLGIPADYDATSQFWYAWVYEDDLNLGPNEFSNSYVFTLEGDLILNNGSVILPDDEYLNFGALQGVTGRGIRDNLGVPEVKDSPGSWFPIGSRIPVGGVYCNSTGTDPASELGYGTWTMVFSGPQPQESFPVGSCYLNTTDVDPSIELGYGTWTLLISGTETDVAIWLRI